MTEGRDRSCIPRQEKAEESLPRNEKRNGIYMYISGLEGYKCRDVGLGEIEN